jgi:formate hydrogenlyase transcriptional activator
MESKGRLSEIQNQEHISLNIDGATHLENENARLLKLLEQKERENAVVLSLSNSIASIRNKLDLFDVIHQKLKKLFDFDDFVICLINNDRETHSAFIYNQKEDFLKTAGIAPKASEKYTLDDGMCRAMKLILGYSITAQAIRQTFGALIQISISKKVETSISTTWALNVIMQNLKKA